MELDDDPTYRILSRAKKIGTYLDEDIWQYVELEDGRMFIFESLAVEKNFGVYATDCSESTYILVYPNLLYREIKNS